MKRGALLLPDRAMPSVKVLWEYLASYVYSGSLVKLKCHAVHSGVIKPHNSRIYLRRKINNYLFLVNIDDGNFIVK